MNGFAFRPEDDEEKAHMSSNKIDDLVGQHLKQHGSDPTSSIHIRRSGMASWGKGKDWNAVHLVEDGTPSEGHVEGTVRKLRALGHYVRYSRNK